MTNEEKRTLNSADWQEVFSFAHHRAHPKWAGSPNENKPSTFNRIFNSSQVKEIIVWRDGEKYHRSEWRGVFKLTTGRFAYICATCGSDWESDGAGYSFVADSLDALLRYGMTPAERTALGLHTTDEYHHGVST